MRVKEEMVSIDDLDSNFRVRHPSSHLLLPDDPIFDPPYSLR